jgi:hypothetical protein
VCEQLHAADTLLWGKTTPHRFNWIPDGTRSQSGRSCEQDSSPYFPVLLPVPYSRLMEKLSLQGLISVCVRARVRVRESTRLSEVGRK